MKAMACAVLFFGVSLIVPLKVTSQNLRVPRVRIEGTYENLTVGKSGDLEGMRVILIDGGGSMQVIVQKAQGGAVLPEAVLSRVNVKGADINFSIKFPGQDHAETFLGTVSTGGLRLQRGDRGDPLRPSFLGPLPGERPFFLKRKRC
jgi:hypothetical protein